MVRRDPNTINTGVQGVGSTTPIIGNTLAAPGTGSDYELSQKRKGLTFAVSKWIVPNLAFDASYKFEDKQGSRLFGIGNYCSNVISPVCTGANGTVGALYLTPEPIDSTTQQFEAKLTYSGATFSITAGYYGGFYSNGNSVMTPVFPNGGSTLTNTGDTLGPLAGLLSQPLALPPDNQSNQFYLSGNTSLPLNTRINYKAAYTHATQNAEYPSQLLVGASPALATLNGTLDTTVLQAGLTSRPMPKLTINGSLRWEDRQDKSDRNIYVVAPNGTQYTNNPTNSTFGNAKLEAGYQVTDVDRASLGVDYLNVDRERPLSSTWIPDTSMAAMRESNNETGVYGEWRRSMSDTLNGALTYRYAKREGYHWYALDPALGFPFVRYDSFTPEKGTFPATMLDRTRQTDQADGRLVAHRCVLAELLARGRQGQLRRTEQRGRGPERHQGPVLQPRCGLAVVGQLEDDRLRELRQAEPEHAAGHRLHRCAGTDQHCRGARHRRHHQGRARRGGRRNLPGRQEQLRPRA